MRRSSFGGRKDALDNIHIEEATEGMRIFYAYGDALGVDFAERNEKVGFEARFKVAGFDFGIGKSGAQRPHSRICYGEGEGVALF